MLAHIVAVALAAKPLRLRWQETVRCLALEFNTAQCSLLKKLLECRMQPSIYGCMQEDVKEVLESHKVIVKCHSSFLSAKQTFQVLLIT